MKDSIIEKEINKLIDDVIKDITIDLTKTKDDYNSYIFNLETINNLYIILRTGNLEDIIIIEHTYKNEGLYKLQDVLRNMMSE